MSLKDSLIANICLASVALPGHQPKSTTATRHGLIETKNITDCRGGCTPTAHSQVGVANVDSESVTSDNSNGYETDQTSDRNIAQPRQTTGLTAGPGRELGRNGACPIEVNVEVIVGNNNTSSDDDEDIDPMSRVTLRRGGARRVGGREVVLNYDTEEDTEDDCTSSDSSSSGDEFESADENPSNMCPICSKLLPTVIGVKIHIAAKHKEIANAAKGEGTRRKWFSEELRVLAKEEAQAITENVRFMNIHLHKKFPERSLEAIKGQRRQARYKTMVEEYKASSRRRSSISVARRSMGVPAEISTVSVGDELVFEINGECASLEVRGGRSAELVDIVRRVLSGEALIAELMAWIKVMCPVAESNRGPNVRRIRVPTGNAKERRKQAYAAIQELYKSDKKAVLRGILEEGAEGVEHPDTNDMFEYWKGLMGRAGKTVNLRPEGNEEGLRSLWYPVTIDEVKANKVESTAAPGPDGIKPSVWNKVPVRFVQLIFNCFIKSGRIPDELSLARTIFIPKKSLGRLGPDEFRPITIASVIARHFHKILACRLQTHYDFDHRQRAFLPLDGTIENLSVLNGVLSDARQRNRELHLAALDVAKAFDSVYFQAITASLVAIGAPVGFVEYITNLYANSATVLQFSGEERVVKVQRGVRQGDPLSPLLFNLIIEQCIKGLDDDVGYEIDETRINGLAYADDVILMAHTPVGLQRNLDRFSEGLGRFGLTLNVEKSGVLSIMPCKKSKAYLVSSTRRFKVEDIWIPQRGVCEIWKYLGVIFEGARLMESKCSIYEDLKKLTAAPLKPQQRLLLLKQYLLPRYYHGLVLGRTTKKMLEKADLHVRNFVRGWLRLPRDTPLGYFYSTVKDGGIGIPHLTYRIACTKQRRLLKLAESDSEISRAASVMPIVERQLAWCANTLSALIEPTSRGINRFWRDKLYSSIDGKDLSLLKEIGPSCDWVRNTSAITGSDYVHFHHVRINSLPSRARCNRGVTRTGPTNCRAGCNQVETGYHAIQQCFRTHGGRIKRHDLICNASGAWLKKKGYTIVYEPKLRTSLGLRKPDILAIKDGVCLVLDGQVVKGDNMERDFKTKVSKYKDIPEFERLIASKYAVSKVRYIAITLSYRGIWCQSSYRAMKEIGFPENVLSGLTKTALRGSWINWKRFNTLNTQIWGGRSG